MTAQEKVKEAHAHHEHLKQIALKLFEQLKSEKVDFFGCRTHRQYAVGVRKIGTGQSDALIHTVREVNSMNHYPRTLEEQEQLDRAVEEIDRKMQTEEKAYRERIRQMPIYNSIIRPCVMGIPEDGAYTAPIHPGTLPITLA